jgi:hypothetical protein
MKISHTLNKTAYNLKNKRAISFKKDKLKLFVPARSCILDSKDHYLKENSTWLKCPEMEDFQAIGLKYDIWYRIIF